MGKLVDKRADIWAFGVLLWELLTGTRLFQGETVTDTLVGVLRGLIGQDDPAPALSRPRLRLVGPDGTNYNRRPLA